jgi:hypothetical protein
MKRWSADLLVAVLAVFLCAMGVLISPAYAGQSAMQASSTHTAATTAKGHGTFSVELVKPLDSKKLKVGDPVEAKLTGGITLPSGATVPKGARVTGHVTQAKARSKSDSESALGISFDKVEWSGNEGVSIKGTIQAVAPNPNADRTTGGYIDYGPSLREATTNPGPPDAGKPSTPTLNDRSTGVLGIKNMQLGPDGVLTSSGKEVRLDSGTRMMLNVSVE